MLEKDPLEEFHPVVRAWFTKRFREPSPPQLLGWPPISSGQNTLILAPTGSGKTLAAFLWAINHLVEQRLREELPPGVRILYVSPLKALNNDIHRNLEEPLTGIMEEARASSLRLDAIRTEVRTGDTPQSKRQAMLRHPPDILITTPESLYLLLTSAVARKMLRTVQYVIVDEIHSVCGNKRGVHLSLSLERLTAIADQEFARIGLSATQRPLEHTAAFLGGQYWEGGHLLPRPVTIVDAGFRKQTDLRVVCAPSDFSLLPPDGVWPLVFEELLHLITRHTTTLVFVNNRRLAERVAAKLNELITGTHDTMNLYAAPQQTGWSAKYEESPDDQRPAASTSIPLVQAYHGSMSRQAREQMEADLKAGRMRALVATSSLELGIDIGSIDLVLQLQSPKGIARGLQRVGRSGHLITATSKGRIFPTHREDLVESAVVAREMLRHNVERTVIPSNCLDVLAQQIVAMVSMDDWNADELYDLIRQSYCYRTVSEAAYSSVLHMLAGRYNHEAFRDLRGRISWDKADNTLRALPGSARLAITSGGTISDRGYYGVYLEDRRTKVGEVDEEFVFESRVGDTFILGTSVWRMREIDPNRIIVAPAPGQPARMPFWRGEGIGRSYELGRQIGAFRREMSARASLPACLSWLQHEYPIDSSSAWNIHEYFRKQLDATGILPDDRTLLVEGFRDEIGDPRIVIHSAFGRRVNGLLGLIASRRLHQRIGTEPQMLYNDDGILLRCSEVDELPLDLLDALTLKESEDILLEDIMMSPLFGGQFRQNAARALLMPRAAPGKRTPLWLQRLRAGDLLQIVRQLPATDPLPSGGTDFPLLTETIREVLNDILDFEHFKELVKGLETGSIRTRNVRNEIPSPFATSLLFDFIAVYMYEWDQPRADRQSQYLAINREVLSELLDLESARNLLRPEAIEVVESQLQHRATGYKARSPEELFEILLRVGDLTDEEIRRCSVSGDLELVHHLAADGRVATIPFPEGNRWVTSEESLIYRAQLNEKSAGHVLRRYVQSRGPITSGEIVQRYSLSPTMVRQVLDHIASNGEVVKGHFFETAGAPHDVDQWCYRPNLERIHRETISLLRKEITPSSFEEFTSFLHHWQGLHSGTRRAGIEGVESILAQLEGLPLPAEIWEREILSRRLRSYTTEPLSQLTATGEVVWVGAGPGRMKVFQRGNGLISLSPPDEKGDHQRGEPARRILRYLTEHGASFLRDVRVGTRLSLQATNNGIAELFWGSVITNDLFEELQNVKRAPRLDEQLPLERVILTTPQHNPARGKLMHSMRRAIRQAPGWAGRWSLVHLPAVMGDELPAEEIARRQARRLLERYGILARELYRREDLLPWGLIAGELQRMEMRGEIRRGYFVEGLSGMQYALPSAVDHLRGIRPSEGQDVSLLLLNACDPANPYGPGVQAVVQAANGIELRVSRLPGNYFVFRGGTPVLLLENSGARVWMLAGCDTDMLRSGLTLFISMMRLPAPLRPFREIKVEYCNGDRASESVVGPVLRTLGFRRDQNQTMSYDGFT
jgi:ATP-dependent Lhr-like helicase